MDGIKYGKQSARHEQIKNLNPYDNMETDAERYGDDKDISTQIVTNYNYHPGSK